MNIDAVTFVASTQTFHEWMNRTDSPFGHDQFLDEFHALSVVESPPFATRPPVVVFRRDDLPHIYFLAVIEGDTCRFIGGRNLTRTRSARSFADEYDPLPADSVAWDEYPESASLDVRAEWVKDQKTKAQAVYEMNAGKRGRLLRGAAVERRGYLGKLQTAINLERERATQEAAAKKRERATQEAAAKKREAIEGGMLSPRYITASMARRSDFRRGLDKCRGWCFNLLAAAKGRAEAAGRTELAAELGLVIAEYKETVEARIAAIESLAATGEASDQGEKS